MLRTQSFRECYSLCILCHYLLSGLILIKRTVHCTYTSYAKHLVIVLMIHACKGYTKNTPPHNSDSWCLKQFTSTYNLVVYVTRDFNTKQSRDSLIDIKYEWSYDLNYKYILIDFSSYIYSNFELQKNLEERSMDKW